MTFHSGLSVTPLWNLTACDPSGVHNYEIMDSTKDIIVCACAPWMSNVRTLFLTLHFSCLIEDKVYNHQVNPEVAKSSSYGLQRWGTETGSVFLQGREKPCGGGLIPSFRCWQSLLFCLLLSLNDKRSQFSSFQRRNAIFLHPNKLRVRDGLDLWIYRPWRSSGCHQLSIQNTSLWATRSSQGRQRATHCRNADSSASSGTTIFPNS